MLILQKNVKEDQSNLKEKIRGEIRTERELCLEKGLVRIWDCGKKKWVYNFTSKTSSEQK